MGRKSAMQEHRSEQPRAGREVPTKFYVPRSDVIKFFLVRPRLYGELAYRVKRRLFGSSAHERLALEETREAAIEWCREVAVSTEAAFARVLAPAARPAIDELYPDVLAAARAAEARCPVPMGGGAHMDLLYWLAEGLQATRVVETGVAYGWSSLALLLSIRRRAGALLISSDMPYPGRNNDRFVGCVVPPSLRAHWRVISKSDRAALPRALRELDAPIDLCHYDSDKTYEGRLWAYGLLWSALRPGGLLVSDDVHNNMGFRDFAERAEVEPIVVEFNGKYVGILVRGAGASA
jgi:predicted O-methyltransferase YrrM